MLYCFIFKRGVIMALDYVVIGQRLKKARIEKKLTQEKIAEELGVSVAFISRVECGNAKVNLTRLSEICHILGISEGNILNGASSNSYSYLSNEFHDILKKCSPEKQKLICKIAELIANEKN